ncbi:MAG: hypothetical protein HQM00_09845 [Magnetococcales bacterium]|nr:hypothetical protein [Magnetococcales bacterium]
MNTLSSPNPEDAALPENRERLRQRLAQQLFETAPAEIGPLLAHAPWNNTTRRPSPEALTAPLAAGLKRFRISW